MEAAAASAPPSELNRVGFRIYEAFRPEVPEDVEGWGAKGQLDPARIVAAAWKVLGRERRVFFVMAVTYPLACLPWPIVLTSGGQISRSTCGSRCSCSRCCLECSTPSWPWMPPRAANSARTWRTPHCYGRWGADHSVRTWPAPVVGRTGGAGAAGRD